MPIAKQEKARLAKLFGRAQMEENPARAADIFYDAWNQTWALIKREGITSAEAVRRKLGEDIWVWAEETLEALGCALRYGQQRALCEDLLTLRWDECDEITRRNLRLCLASAHSKMGNLHEATALLEEWVQAQPDCAEYRARHLLALEDEKDERLPAALEQTAERFKEANDIDVLDLYTCMGGIYQRAGEAEKAQACFARGEEMKEKASRRIGGQMENFMEHWEGASAAESAGAQLKEKGYAMKGDHAFLRGLYPAKTPRSEESRWRLP